jgi:hypothetical protein
MSLHRAMFFVLGLLFTAGMTSAASACCGWGPQAPFAYAPAGCGGCVTPTAAAVYAAPVAPAPPPVAWRTWPRRTWAWGTGCGCHRAYVYAATPALTLTPIAPAPIYVVNQGPDYTGPGITVPYHLWRTGSYIAPGSYPYVSGYGYWHRYGYRYGVHPRFFAPRRYVSYRPHFYGHPLYHRPWYGMHHWHR